jgi:cell wall-associated NlpC family hydrolase
MLPLVLGGAFLLLAGCGGGAKSYAVRASFQKANPNYVAPKSQKKSSSSSSSKKSNAPKKSNQKNSSGSSNLATGGSAPVPSMQLKKKIKPYIGVRYKYGGTTKKGMDCSGLIWRVFQDLGYVGFSRTSSQVMYNNGTHVKRDKTRPGDLVFFSKNGSVNHVGIYMGKGVFAHASSSKGVMYSNLSNVYWSKRFLGFRRI